MNYQNSLEMFFIITNRMQFIKCRSFDNLESYKIIVKLKIMIRLTESNLKC